MDAWHGYICHSQPPWVKDRSNVVSKDVVINNCSRKISQPNIIIVGFFSFFLHNMYCSFHSVFPPLTQWKTSTPAASTLLSFLEIFDRQQIDFVHGSTFCFRCSRFCSSGENKGNLAPIISFMACLIILCMHVLFLCDHTNDTFHFSHIALSSITHCQSFVCKRSLETDLFFSLRDALLTGWVEGRVWHSCRDYQSRERVLRDYPGAHPRSSADM